MITAADITTAIRGLGIASDDVLFVHSGLKGALRLEGATREAKLATMTDGLRDAVPDGVLAVPTFTYSFTRDEVFDVQQSPSTVGVLTEHLRSLPEARRTTDPLFSCAILGELPEPWAGRLLDVHERYDCFGPESVFAWLEEADAHLLFLGVGFDQCTFLYLVEQRLGVPYRYFKDFPGTIAHDGGETPAVARYYVRDLDAGVVNDFGRLEADLRALGALRATKLERGPELLAVRARDVAAAIEDGLARDPRFLLAAEG